MRISKIELSKDAVTARLEKFDFDLCSIAHSDVPRFQSMDRHYLSTFRLTIITEGSMVFHVGGVKHRLKTGACAIMAPGSLSEGSIVREDDNCHFVSFYFDFPDPTQSENFKSLIGLRDSLVYEDILTDSTVDLIKCAYIGVEDKHPGCYYFAKLALMLVLGRIIYSREVNPLASVLRNDKSSTEEALVLKCHNYILNNPGRNVEVEDLCKIFGVSQSYMYKCFKNVLKMSTKEFITLTKIHMTEAALLRTDKTIYDIAMENGYANSYQYSNIFKRVHGISPSAFRKQNRM